MEGDPTLGALQIEEVKKLRRVLSILLPVHPPPNPAGVM